MSKDQIASSMNYSFNEEITLLFLKHASTHLDNLVHKPAICWSYIFEFCGSFLDIDMSIIRPGSPVNVTQPDGALLGMLILSSLS